MCKKATVGDKALHDNNVWTVKESYSPDGIHTYYVLGRNRGIGYTEKEVRSDYIDLVQRMD